MDTPLHAKDSVFDDSTQSGLFPLHENTERFSPQTINHVVFDCVFSTTPRVQRSHASTWTIEQAGRSTTGGSGDTECKSNSLAPPILSLGREGLQEIGRGYCPRCLYLLSSYQHHAMCHVLASIISHFVFSPNRKYPGPHLHLYVADQDKLFVSSKRRMRDLASCDNRC